MKFLGYVVASCALLCSLAGYAYADFRTIQQETYWDAVGSSAPQAFAETSQELPSNLPESTEPGNIAVDEGDTLFTLQRDKGIRVYRLHTEEPLHTSIADLNVRGARAFALGDLNHDGLTDIYVATHADENGVSRPDVVYFGTEGDGFEKSPHELPASNSVDVAIGELNGDTRLDVVVAQRGAVPNQIYMSTRSGSLEPSDVVLGEGEGQGVALGDLDQDGSMDIYMLYTNGVGAVWFGEGRGAFEMGSNEALPASVESVRSVECIPDARDSTTWFEPNNVCLVLLGEGYQSVRSATAQTGELVTEFETNEAGVKDLLVMDFDMDGDADFLASRGNEPAKVWFSEESEGDSGRDSIELPQLTGSALVLIPMQDPRGGQVWSMAQGPDIEGSLINWGDECKASNESRRFRLDTQRELCIEEVLSESECIDLHTCTAGTIDYATCSCVPDMGQTSNTGYTGAMGNTGNYGYTGAMGCHAYSYCEDGEFFDTTTCTCVASPNNGSNANASSGDGCSVTTQHTHSTPMRNILFFSALALGAGLVHRRRRHRA